LALPVPSERTNHPVFNPVWHSLSRCGSERGDAHGYGGRGSTQGVFPEKLPVAVRWLRLGNLRQTQSDARASLVRAGWLVRLPRSAHAPAGGQGGYRGRFSLAGRGEFGIFTSAT